MFLRRRREKDDSADGLITRPFRSSFVSVSNVHHVSSDRPGYGPMDLMACWPLSDRTKVAIAPLTK